MYDADNRKQIFREILALFTHGGTMEISRPAAVDHNFLSKSLLTFVKP